MNQKEDFLSKTGTKEKLDQIKPELNDPSVKKFTSNLMDKEKKDGAVIYDNLGLGNILNDIVKNKNLKEIDQNTLKVMMALQDQHADALYQSRQK